MVGEASLTATTYQGGTGLHTNTLITLQGMVTVGSVRGMAVVKKNFVGADGADVSEEQVFADPGKYLRVQTVMYQREPGYDAENQDWFYAVYAPNGNVVVNPMGMNMAGRFAAGLPDDVPFGCIACHAVNGVGGHDATNMDAHAMNGLMNPFDFAAKMWNHAPCMIAAQQGAFGEQIYFTGDDLADIIKVKSYTALKAGKCPEIDRGEAIPVEGVGYARRRAFNRYQSPTGNMALVVNRYTL